MSSLDEAYFASLYRENSDPWSFAESAYEAAKYAATLAALPRQRYARAFEPGCSIGILTAQLAQRCDALLAVDIAEQPLIAARERCAASPHVSFARMDVPGTWPEVLFDLIVLSEIVYYLCPRDVEQLSDRIKVSLAPAGHLVMVHWLGETDYPLTGDEAAVGLIRRTAPELAVVRTERTESYRLDVLERGSPG